MSHSDSIPVQLDRAIENQQWDAAADLFRNHPEESQRRHHPHQWTQLHWLCSIGGTPTYLIDLVASLFPEAISIPDDYLGDTCLHIVCRNSQLTVGKLDALLKYCPHPDVLLIRNRVGGTALHSAANHNALLPVFISLIRTNPKILSVTTHEGLHALSALWLAFVQTIPGHMLGVRILEVNDGGETATGGLWDRFWNKVAFLATRYFAQSPYCPEHLLLLSEDDADAAAAARMQSYIPHALLRCNVPINMFKVALLVTATTTTTPSGLCKAADEQRPSLPSTSPCYVADKHGNLVLHTLIENRPWRLKEREAITACLQAGPDAAGRSNDNGDCPLILAIRNRMPYENGIDLLVQQAPTTVGWVDAETGLYPFHLAAQIGGNVAIDTVFQLLLLQPDLLKKMRVSKMI